MYNELMTGTLVSLQAQMAQHTMPGHRFWRDPHVGNHQCRPAWTIILLLN